MSYDDEKQPTQKVAPPVNAKQVSWPLIRTQKELSQAADSHQNGGQVYALQGKKIGEILNALKVIDDQILHAVEQHHQNRKDNTKPIGQLLIHMGIIEPEVLTRALCIQTGVPMVDVLNIHIPQDVLGRITNEQAVEKKIVPVGVYNKALYMAVSDPASFADHHHFAFLTKLSIKAVFSPLHEIENFINTKWAGTGADIWAG